MSRYSSVVAFAGALMLLCGVATAADTLRCQSVNGNVNCAGSSGASCQTVNGKTVCSSGHGDVVQSFGGGSVPEMSGDVDRLQQRDRTMLLQREAAKLHLRSDWLSEDQD